MDVDFAMFIAVGFFAQLIDGAIGMGYGVIATSVLVAGGMPPAMASAAVHVTKIPTGIASGLSHWKFRNVDWGLCRRLILPGLAGGIVGASVIALLPLHIIRPLAALYLGLMGLMVILRALRWKGTAQFGTPRGRPEAVGLLGGLFDSFGGGWGPIVTTSLVMQGREPRRAVGSSNTAEPVVAAIQAAVFAFWLGTATLTTIGSTALAIMIGALVAAPMAAFLVTRLPGRLIAGAVGVVLIAINVPTLIVLIGRLI